MQNNRKRRVPVERIKPKDRFPAALALVLFGLVGLLKIFKANVPVLSDVIFLMTNLVFIGIIMCWMIYTQRSILSKKIRNIITVLSLLMMFYIFVRTCKYRYFSGVETALRYLWYLYYLPQLFAPLLAFVVADRVGKTEEYRLSRAYGVLFLAAAVLFIGIMTNDIHQLAFRFNPDLVNWDDDYDYGPLFYAVVIWIYFWIFAAVGLLSYKCKAVNKKAELVPIFWLALGTAYIILLSFKSSSLPFQLPETHCFIFIAVIESCIRMGLLPSNTGYREYISNSSAAVQIADADGNVVYSSKNALALTREQMKLAVKEPVFIGRNTVLNSKAVSGGNIFWTDDISAVNKIIDELVEMGEQLSEKSRLLKAETELKEQQTRIEEQNRLYDGIAVLVKPQLDKIAELIGDESKLDRNIPLACVLTCYIKRRANLTLLADGAELLDVRELYLSINESAEYLKLYGTPACVSCGGEFMMPAESALLAFDLWQAVIEAFLPGLEAVMSRLCEENGSFVMRITADSELDFSVSDGLKDRIKKSDGELCSVYEDGTRFITLSLPKGGDAR